MKVRDSLNCLVFVISKTSDNTTDSLIIESKDLVERH